MSRNVRLQATMRLLAQVQEVLSTPVDTLCCSDDLMRIVRTIEANQPLTLLDVGIIEDDRLLEYAQHIGFNTSDARVSQLQRLELLRSVAVDLGAREREAMTNLLTDALETSDAVVTVARGEYANGIESWFNDDLVLIAITDGGIAVVDQAAPSGNCAEHLENIVTLLEDAGVHIAVTHLDKHDEQPGPLIAAAAATGEASLAKAISECATPPPIHRETKSRRAPVNQVIFAGEARL